MSIILKALKSSESNSGETSNINEGFFSGKRSLIKKSAPRNNKRAYVLAGIFVALLVISFAVKWWRSGGVVTSDRSSAVSGAIIPPLPATTVPAGREKGGEGLPAIALAKAGGFEQGAANNVISRASEAYSSGNYDESIRLYKEALKTDPGNALLHNNLGLVFVKKDLFSSAADEYKRSLELDGNCAECFNNFGFLKSLLDETVEARKYLEKAVMLQNSYPDPYFNIAVLYEKEGDVGNAVKNYRQFVEAYPDKQDPIISKVNKRIIELAGK